MAQICYRDRCGNLIAIQNPTNSQWNEATKAIAENIVALAGLGTGARQPYDLELKADKA